MKEPFARPETPQGDIRATTPSRSTGEESRAETPQVRYARPYETPRGKSTDRSAKRMRMGEDFHIASGVLYGELRKGLGGKRASQPFRWSDFDSAAAIFARYGYRAICAIRDVVGLERDLFAHQSISGYVGGN